MTVIEIQKWAKPNGDLMTLSEYKRHSHLAKREGVTLEELLFTQGITERYSYGDTQTPHNNSAKLVTWLKPSPVRFLTYWKYKEYSGDIKDKGLSIEEYLRQQGFIRITEYYKDTKTNYATRWVHEDSGEILFRRDYLREYNIARRTKVPIRDYLISLGYIELLPSKKTPQTQLQKLK